MADWQDISTAPKDGTEILGTRFNELLGRYETAVIKWTDNTWKVVPTKDFRLSHMATKWMHLPEPPNE